MKEMKRGCDRLVAAALGMCLMILPAAAAPQEPGEPVADWDLKLRLAALGEGERDLGIPPGPGGMAAEATEAGFFDIYPALMLRPSDYFSAYIRLQGYAATDQVFQEEDQRVVRARSYAALRELWAEFSHIAGYPGQRIRLGLQRVRDPDGLWWDEDIESARWIFDTTLLQFHLGAAQRFATYRTDDVDLPASQEDRPYVFGGLGSQWLPGHFVGLRGAYAADGVDSLPQPGTIPTPEDEREDRSYTWLGLNLHNGYYEYREPPPVAYWGELVLLTGSRDVSRVDPATGAVSMIDSQDVRAFGSDVGLRFRLPKAPVAFGAAYAYGEGGGTAERHETFEQTGLHSNRSRFTGTRSAMNRFNEALRADLSNLRVTTAYVSFPAKAFDASLVYHRFRRVDVFTPISVDGIDIDPVNPVDDIGSGWDLVIAGYFGKTQAGYGWGGDLRNNVRLRGSVFRPGDAYPAGAEDQYRAILELTLWF